MSYVKGSSKPDGVLEMEVKVHLGPKTNKTKPKEKQSSIKLCVGQSHRVYIC